MHSEGAVPWCASFGKLRLKKWHNVIFEFFVGSVNALSLSTFSHHILIDGEITWQDNLFSSIYFQRPLLVSQQSVAGDSQVRTHAA
jgi:hypothetical protein